MSQNRESQLGAMLGLAIGDALGWPAYYHRSHKLPFWTRRLRREIDVESENTGIIRSVVPFSLNRPQKPLDLGPTDDTEWAVFTAQILRKSSEENLQEDIYTAWSTLAQEEGVKGGISQIAALSNIRKGLKPPITGHDNPHYFDDGACGRAVPIGVFYAGKPQKAAEIAEFEASVTNSKDGVWAAKGMAAGIAVACDQGDSTEVIETVCQYLPEKSWLGRTVERALKIASEEDSLFSALPRLSDEIINNIYSYATTAPETLAISLAIVSLVKNDFSTGIMGATSIARTADSVPALVGALLGAITGQKSIPDNWLNRVQTLQGICIPHLDGVDYLEVIQKLLTC